MVKSFYILFFLFLPFTLIPQKVIIKGKTISYYSKKKEKNVKIEVNLADTLIGTYHSNGTFKIPVNKKGIIKISFKKEGFIDKFFLINTKDIPKYLSNKKLNLKADVSIIKIDTNMLDNTIPNSVGYAYFSKKYKAFIWDPEYTKKAQVAMDAKVFPLEEVVKLDSALNPKTKKFYFQNGMNILINHTLVNNQFFPSLDKSTSKSKIKKAVQNGYLYCKFQTAILSNQLDEANSYLTELFPTKTPLSSISEALKSCKELNTTILDDEITAIGYWAGLINNIDSSNISSFSKIAVKIKELEKDFVSISMTDGELSFYSDVKSTAKKAIQLNQLLQSLNDHEKKKPENYQALYRSFIDQFMILIRNSELIQL